MGCEDRMSGKKRGKSFFLVLDLHIWKWWGVWEGESYGGGVRTLVEKVEWNG